ncbi:hypothetical protein HK405_001449 [Cladochytrium tenue]|nr:hypothetical protein HK405_001449 [Cladochytrium tenue]
MRPPFDPWLRAIAPTASPTAAAATSTAGVDAAMHKPCRPGRDPVATLIAALDGHAVVARQPAPSPPTPLQLLRSQPEREGSLDCPAYLNVGFPLPMAPFKILDDENLILLADFDRSGLVLPDWLPYSPPASIYRDAAVPPSGDPAQALEDRAFRLFCNENVCLVMRASQHQLVTVTDAVATLRRVWDDDVAAGPLSVFSPEYLRRVSTSADREDDNNDLNDDGGTWFADATAEFPAFPAPLGVVAPAQHAPTAPPPSPPSAATYKPIAPAKTVSPSQSPSLPQALGQLMSTTVLLPATRRGGARRRTPSSSSGSTSSRLPRGLAFHDFDPSKAGRHNSAPSLRREYRRRASVNSRAAKGLQDATTTAAAATMALVKQAPEHNVVAPVSGWGRGAGKADKEAAVDVSDVVRLMELLSAELQVSDGGADVAVGSQTLNSPVQPLAPVSTAVEELPPPSPLFLQGLTPFGGCKVHEPSSGDGEVLLAAAPDPQPLLLWDAINATLRLGASGLEPEALRFM